MEPVVGVDVAKGSSVVQTFRKRNEPVGKAKEFSVQESSQRPVHESRN